jgi:regulator of sigma E protease
VYLAGHESPAYRQQPATIGTIAEGSVAAAAQVRPGDVITRVGVQPVSTWDELEHVVATTPGGPFDLLVRRGPALVSLFVTPTDRSGRSLSTDVLGIAPIARPQIVVVNPGEPGDRAGLRVGDVVLAANGAPIVSGAQLHDLIASTGQEPLTLWVYRKGAERNIDVAPREGRLGITFQHEVALERLSLPSAIVAGVRETASNARLMLSTVLGIFTSGASPRDLIGPIGMAQLSGQSAKRGWLPLVSLMALLSLNLGLLNLLPIPVLDGGHIFIMAIESMAQRDFTRAAKRRLVTAGLAVLLMLMSSALYNDLARLLG